MPIVLPPLAGIALKYTTVALASYALAHATGPARPNPVLDAIMDDTAEGPSLELANGQISANFRWRGALRLPSLGRGYQIDATALTRLKVNRLT